MRFTGVFQDCAADIIDVWRHQFMDGTADPAEMAAVLSGRLKANMILSVTETVSADPMDFKVRFLHRFSLPSGILTGGDQQKDQKFSEFRDQAYLHSNVIPTYRTVLEMRQPHIDQVSARLLGFRVLYDRILLPEPRREGRPRWCMSLTETRFALPLPRRDPKIVDDDVRVLQLLREGDSAKEISEKLSLSRRTIEGRIERLKKRFGARNMAHLIVMSISHAADAELGIGKRSRSFFGDDR
ncbi:helix-turn-helix transcriptional regulator [Agrobacterium rubi]|nr:helix-turn-helix transcriptional regulator [Agrobacterium rubi]NTF23987.1 helix-turn-helix transcriptional regulator [Agrobacterium rubi]